MLKMYKRVLWPLSTSPAVRVLQNNQIRRLRESSAPSTESPSSDDFYALLLENPTPNPARRSIDHLEAEDTGKSPLPPNSEPSAPPQSSTPQVSFSTPLAGPSARIRGLARAAQGLERPKEPDNCCMSGCVNCVWDAYREEVEEWAAARRKREVEAGGEKHARAKGTQENAEGGVGDLDGVSGKVNGYEGTDMEHEGALFADVPVGIREFMATEKRLRERRERDTVR